MRSNALFLILLLCATTAGAAAREEPSKEPTFMSRTISGSFEVSLTPLPPGPQEEDFGAGRMSIAKTFSGALEGTSKGQMLAVRTSVDGSAGYVAMERVRGTLEGRAGSFVLQHSSTLRRGEPKQSIAVVPDSATGGLTGLSGTMTIDITDGEHFYTFEYSLPDPAAVAGDEAAKE